MTCLAARQAHSAHAGGVATHRPHVVLGETDGLALGRRTGSRRSVPSVIATPTSLSPGSSSTAMMPAARGRENADNGVFLTVPVAVAMKM